MHAEKNASNKKLGFWTTTSLVMGNMIGAGFFLLPATLASFGGIGLLGWIVSGIGAMLIAIVFSRMSRILPGIDGGPYAYTRAGLGDFAGFLVAWGYWISCWTTNAAIAVSIVSALSSFFPAMTENSLLAVFTGLGFIWVLTWVNTLGIRLSGKIQFLLTALKLIPILAVAIGGFFYFKGSHFLPFNRTDDSPLQVVAMASTLTLFAFLGVECATIPAGNIRNPHKTIPRATMMGTGLTTIVYLLCTLSLMGVIAPTELQHSPTPFADVASAMWGKNARPWMSAGILIASVGALNGWILIQGQMPMAIARDKLFPPVFAKLNRRGVPALGIILSSLLVSLVMIMNFTKGLVEQFRFMILLTTFTTLIPYIFVTASSVIVPKSGQRLSAGAWVRLLIPTSLAFLFSLLAVIGSGETAVFWGIVLLLAGIPLYVWMKVKRGDNQ